MALDPSCVQGIIWDLDNTLYQFTDALKRNCNIAAAKAAKNLGIDLSYDATLKIAERSEDEHGYSMHIYVTDHGLSYADLHFPFHQGIDENVIQPIEGVLDCLKPFDGHQVILTNASRCWATRALKYIGVDHVFKETEIIPMEDVGFEPKAKSDLGFKRAVEVLGLSPENILMVDDLDRNLIIPHDMGMQTAYMSYDDPFEVMPDYVDGQYHDLTHLMKVFQ